MANEREKVRAHLWLYKDDVEFLQTHFGGTDNVGYSKIIREMVAKNVRTFREAMTRNATTKHLENIENVRLPTDTE